jgi:hypothetical protein
MRYLLGVLGLALTGSILWAMSLKPMGESFSTLISDPWMIVTLGDLYLGLIIFILFIFKTSKNYLQATAWSISLLVLGNVVSVVYVIQYLTVKKNQESEHL